MIVWLTNLCDYEMLTNNNEDIYEILWLIYDFFLTPEFNQILLLIG